MNWVKNFVKDIKDAQLEVDQRFSKNYILLSSW